MIKKALLLGGSGFVGTWVANRLSQAGVNVTIPTRRRERNKANIMLPQVEVVEANIHDEATLVELMKGQDVVINLVGVLHDHDSQIPYGKGFGAAHVELPKKIVAAMKQAGVRRLVHMSALGADPQGCSEYVRSKGEGEAIVMAAARDLDVTVFRPSVIFGIGDSFLNTFATVFKYAPSFAAGCLGAKFQPVYVGNVADAFVACIDDVKTFGQRYEMCGPKVYTLRELVEYVRDLTGNKHKKVKELSDLWAYLQAGILWLLPNPPLSPDNLRSMDVDNVASADGQTYPGWNPTPLEAVAPNYLGKVTTKSKLDDFRYHAGR
jgi:NADH dehydrogenase